MEKDFVYRNYGSHVLLIPQTVDAQIWALTHIRVECWQNKNRIMVEPVFFEYLVHHIKFDGLNIQF